MSETVVVARKWGNSIGVTLPKETVDKENIKESERIIITVKKLDSVENFFGTFKSKKHTQKIKNDLRKGWG